MKKVAWFGILIIIILAVGSYFYYQGHALPYTLTLKEENDIRSVYSIIFDSQGTPIHGLLFLPEGNKKVNGVVLLPGAGGDKEKETPLAEQIVSWGYAVLTYDQRGIGETSGIIVSFEEDQKAWEKGQESFYFSMVDDSIEASRVLSLHPRVKDVALAGESMGGRTAALAAVKEKSIKGVVLLASAGYAVPQDAPEYYKALDPDKSISTLPPRPVFIIHGSEDNIIPLFIANNTYLKAREPKKLTIVEGCGHGVCEAMWPVLKGDLEELFRE